MQTDYIIYITHNISDIEYNIYIYYIAPRVVEYSAYDRVAVGNTTRCCYTAAALQESEFNITHILLPIYTYE